jgi:hypothetical protein
MTLIKSYLLLSRHLHWGTFRLSPFSEPTRRTCEGSRWSGSKLPNSTQPSLHTGLPFLVPVTEILFSIEGTE